MKVLASERSHSSCFVLLCVCVFSFLYIAWAGRASLAAMDELTIIVLCAALAGIIVGSLGTLLVFWCIGYFSNFSESSGRGRFGQLNPVLEDALIQAGYGQLDADGNLPTSIQLTRRQTITARDVDVTPGAIPAPWRLHIGDTGTRYHMDDQCMAFPDTSRRVLTLCQVCTRAAVFGLGDNIFASDGGERFHLSRSCRTFKRLVVREYSICPECQPPTTPRSSVTELS